MRRRAGDPAPTAAHVVQPSSAARGTAGCSRSTTVQHPACDAVVDRMWPNRQHGTLRMELPAWQEVSAQRLERSGMGRTASERDAPNRHAPDAVIAVTFVATGCCLNGIGQAAVHPGACGLGTAGNRLGRTARRSGRAAHRTMMSLRIGCTQPICAAARRGWGTGTGALLPLPARGLLPHSAPPTALPVAHSARAAASPWRSRAVRVSVRLRATNAPLAGRNRSARHRHRRA